MFFVDSHCHLDMLDYKNGYNSVRYILTRANTHNVNFFLSVSTTLGSLKTMLNLAGNYSNVVYSCGVHPLNIFNKKWSYNDLCLTALNDRVVAIGETGLDYYRCSNSNVKLRQQISFRKHISASLFLSKPLIIHTRNSAKDVIKILHETQYGKCNGVIHCFTENCHIAKQFLDLGFYISFSGIVTFRNRSSLNKVIRYIPLDCMLLETDSPYLTPLLYKDQQNEPARVRDIARYIANVKNMRLTDLADATTSNFFRLFYLSSNKLIKRHVTI